MKSKQFIKNIGLIAIVLIASMMFLNISFATNDTTEELEEKQSEEYILSENVKIKLMPLIYSTDVTEFAKDSKVIVLRNINGWAYIEQENIKGWIRTEKIKTQEQANAEKENENNDQEKEETEQEIKKMYVKAESVNLRKEPNAESELVGNIPKNKEVEVLEEDNNGWTKCRVNGLVGYISTQYLSNEKVEEPKTETEVTSRSATEARIGTASPVEGEKQAASSSNGSSVVSYAQQYLGSSYVYGASGPDSFDCSGFTKYVYEHFGVNLNRTAAGQYSNGSSVSELQSGDLVLFGSNENNINHVGIYIGNNRFIHAANKSRGVTTDTIASGYYHTNYVGARRVLK